MKRMSPIQMCAWLLFVAGVAATLGAQSAQRLSDKDVEEILEAVDNGRDRFEDQLDGKVKNSILRGPTGEVNVERYLDDLQENVDKLRERFDKKYAASQEAVVVLRQTTQIHKYIKSLPSELKGGSEWDRLVADLTRLANAYGTEFPLPADAPVRRINDAEVSVAAANVAKQADQLKGQLGRDKTLPKAELETIKRDLDDLKKQSGIVKSRSSEGKPATAEARQMLETAARVSTAVGSRPLPGAAWGTMRSNIVTLQQAYGLVMKDPAAAR